MTSSMLRGLSITLLALSVGLPGCDADTDQSRADGGAAGEGGDAGTDGGGAVEVPETYAFNSRFGDESSVAYNGQTFRHVLILAMKSHIGALTTRLDDASFVPTEGDVVAELLFFFDFDGDVAGELSHGVETTPPTAQGTYAELGDANLRAKIAGNDEVGQHADWRTEFVGWSDAEPISPEGLVEQWFAELEQLAIDRANGVVVLAPDGRPVESVYLTADGRDLQQLLQKFLTGAIAFSQGADDYLDDDTEGKGLLADNTEADDDQPYTPLEHAWDEGFGYFGAARNFGAYTDDEVAAAGGRPGYEGGYNDADGDGAIDLKSEYNFGHAVNAAKRDRGSAESARTDYTQQAWDAFRAGRAMIVAADGALDATEMEALKAQRDRALEAWEKAIAATVVHYINDTLQDMAKFDTEDYRFADHAKHWSEMKGFALTLQFNRRSPLSDAQFAELHAKLGTAPALPGDDDATAYADGLRAARALLQAAYGFDDANMGDAHGDGGW